MTRQEYLEGGLNACRRKLGRAYWDDEGLAEALGIAFEGDEVQLS